MERLENRTAERWWDPAEHKGDLQEGFSWQVLGEHLPQSDCSRLQTQRSQTEVEQRKKCL